MKVRRATNDDIAGMVELMDMRRQLYKSFQPIFWRRAPNANAAQARFFASLVGNDGAIVLVCEEREIFRGFIIAILTDAPPVYAPGGKPCMIDDFAVVRDDWSVAGRALLYDGAARCESGRGRAGGSCMRAHG